MLEHPAAERAGGRRPLSPLVRDGVELVPNLTHIVNRDQKIYFYYEVYEPGARQRRRRSCARAWSFYRGKVKVFETPIVERTQPRRRRSHGRGLPVRGAGRQLQARALHLPDQHHRRRRRPLRLSAAADVRAVTDEDPHGDLGGQAAPTIFTKLNSTPGGTFLNVDREHDGP